MQEINTQPRYNLAMRLLHWISGSLLLMMLASGIYMTYLDKTAPYKYDIYKIHKSVGIIVLVLLAFRIITRLFSKIPSLPNDFNKIEAIIAKLTHFFLYLGFSFIALSGFFMAAFSGKPMFFFSWEIPNIAEKNQELASFLHSVHVSLPYWMLALTALHIIAGITNTIFYKKTYSFKRIW